MIDKDPVEKAIFKFNNGNRALLCSKCFTIIKTGIAFSHDENMAFLDHIALGPQYCSDCFCTTRPGSIHDDWDFGD